MVYDEKEWWTFVCLGGVNGGEVSPRCQNLLIFPARK